jgi:hypothetical protein
MTFEPKRYEVPGERRRIRNEEFNDLYSSPNIIRVMKSRRMRLARHDTRMEKSRRARIGFFGKSKGKKPHGRPRQWEDNIKMDLK